MGGSVDPTPAGEMQSPAPAAEPAPVVESAPPAVSPADPSPETTQPAPEQPVTPQVPVTSEPAAEPMVPTAEQPVSVPPSEPVDMAPEAMGPATMEPQPVAPQEPSPMVEPPAVVEAPPEMTAPPEAVPASEYPAGPYGTGDPAVGDVVENLTLRGYFNLDPSVESADTELRDGDMHELRSLGMTHIAVLTAKGWCPTCRTIARNVAGMSDRLSGVANNGGLFVQMLLTGAGTSAPTDVEIDAWAQAANLTTLVVGPGDDRMNAVFPTRQIGYIIELETMRIVFAEDIPGPSSATTLVDRLAELVQ